MKYQDLQPPKAILFEEKSSLVRRLRAIMYAVALLIILGFLGIYFTNKPFVRGLQNLNSSNLTITAINRSLEGLDTSDLEIEKVAAGTDLKDVSYLFEESQRLMKLNLDQAFYHSQQFPNAIAELTNAKNSIYDYEKSFQDLFHLRKVLAERKIQDAEGVSAQLVVNKQFSADIREHLRRANIMTKELSEKMFNDIYKRRFKPLMVALAISTLFLAFVIIFGFSITIRLRESLKNLTVATEEVSKGNFKHKAEVLNQDEIGYVTFAFNQMVRALDIQQEKLQLTADRIFRLQNITSSFSEALTPDQVYDIIIDQGMKALEADAAVVVMISDEGSTLELKRLEGYSDGIKDHFKNYSITSPFPLAEAARYGEPIYIESLKELFERYPVVDRSLDFHYHSTALLPLKVGSEILGSIAFSFSKQRSFSLTDKEYMLALARLSAQALHRSQLFENARKAILARDEFLSIASHELKTPLTPLKLQLQGLARQVNKGSLASLPQERLNKIVETSDKQISRLASLIEDLLDVSRISAGKLNLNKEELDLTEIIEEVVKHYADHLKNVQSDIQLKLQPQVVGTLDKVRIEQVLINLLTNAGKYAPGKPVLIELSTHNDLARIAVKDQGPGIMPQDQQRIFDRFERVRNRDNIGGLGLGLYISKQIVEAHGGNIFVESIPGAGATFIVEIPLHHHIQSTDFLTQTERFL